MVFAKRKTGCVNWETRGSVPTRNAVHLRKFSRIGESLVVAGFTLTSMLVFGIEHSAAFLAGRFSNARLLFCSAMPLDFVSASTLGKHQEKEHTQKGTG